MVPLPHGADRTRPSSPRSVGSVLRRYERTASATNPSGSMSMDKKIAVVGVGLMGSSLARHLIEAGFPVIVHDVDPAKVEAMVKVGAKTVASPDQIPAAVDVIMLSLPNSHVVTDVLTNSLKLFD